MKLTKEQWLQLSAMYWRPGGRLCTAEMRDLFDTIDALEAELASERAASAEREQRQMDLIRYARHFLHTNNCISDDEYAALVQDNDGGQRISRLEGYDTAIQVSREREQAIQAAPRRRP